MKNTGFVLLFIMMAIPAFAQSLGLPFEGRWFVMQGGDTPNVNEHVRLGAQAYGIDFTRVGGPSGRQLTRVPQPTRVEDFFGWAEVVLSPSDGSVVSAVDAFPDNPLGVKDGANALGNHVVIRIRDDRFVYIAHMQQGSVRVKAGDMVKRGQPLGKCGNSGNSDFPHVHLHVQDTPKFNAGQGQNPIFDGIDVELTGQSFKGVTWPLIRGLFVSNTIVPR